MKKELQLTDIVGYLPYELKVKGKKHLFKYGEEPILFVNGVSNNEGWQYEFVHDGDLIFAKLNDKEYKPLLYPIEHLTKEITVKGKTFIPVEWFEIGDETNASYEYDHGNIKLIRNLTSIALNGIHYDLYHIHFGVIQKLYEWHLDIHNLIGRGLALDKTKIK